MYRDKIEHQNHTISIAMHKASESFNNSKAISLLEEPEIKTEEGAFHMGYDNPVTLVSITCNAARTSRACCELLESGQEYNPILLELIY